MGIDRFIEKKYSFICKSAALLWAEHIANKCCYEFRSGKAFYEKGKGGKNWHIIVYTLTK